MSRITKYRWLHRVTTLSGLGVVLMAAAPTEALAHCDTMDGPVVRAGQLALQSGSPNLALVWVRPVDEATILNAFDQALVVRALGSDARQLADRFFLETLVRVHREGEGEPFTGIKPAGTSPGPVIPVADRAVAARSIEELETFLIPLVRQALHERFERVVATDGPAADDLTAGRAHVAAYVALMHYLEEVHALHAGAAARHEQDQPRGGVR